MKPKEKADFLKSLKERGYIEDNNTLYPPNSARGKELIIEAGNCATEKRKALKSIKTGGTDDSRNIRNKQAQKDMFIRMVEQELNLEVWPEFFFSTERLFRFDYAIPEIMLAVECDGGVWSKGNSGHSSGRGITRDQEKSSLAASLGWYLIRVQPSQLLSNYTLELIRKVCAK